MISSIFNEWPKWGLPPEFQVVKLPVNVIARLLFGGLVEDRRWLRHL
jgi:hypothetical protein